MDQSNMVDKKKKLNVWQQRNMAQLDKNGEFTYFLQMCGIERV